MKLNDIFELSDGFFSLATKDEELPAKTKDINKLLENLSGLETFSVRLKHAEDNLKHLSSGSSRTVFDLPDNKVLKLASNEKGISQNSAESKVKIDSKFINKVIDSCPSYYWIIAPKANKISPKKFEKLSGIPFDLFGDLIRTKIKNKDASKEQEKYIDLPMVKEIADIVKKYKLMTGDIARISSYGEIDGNAVLIDLGLNKQTYQKFYASENSQKKIKKSSSGK